MLQDNISLRQWKVHSYPSEAINIIMYIADEKPSKLNIPISPYNVYVY